MYRVSCSPESLIYISESKTLAGKEVRGREDEAMGRPLVLTFFKRDARGLAHRVDNGTSVLKLKTLTLAVLLQTLGHVLPLDPDRTSATAELLLEAHYMDLIVDRFKCVTVQVEEAYVFALENETNAEAEYAVEIDPRTKMVLARCLQRRGKLAANETLQDAWMHSLGHLQARTVALLPAPPAPPAAKAKGKAKAKAAPPPGPPAGPGPAAALPLGPPAVPGGKGVAPGGRGGRAARGRGKGRGRGR